MHLPSTANDCRILGLGSPHGDDQIGWCVIDQLSRDAAFRDRSFKLRSAWDLLDHLPNCGRMVVIDACRSNCPAGTIRRLPAAAVLSCGLSFASTHAESLAEVFRFARAMGQDLSRIIVYAVDIDSCGLVTPLSKTAHHAAEQLVAVVQRDCQDRR